MKPTNFPEVNVTLTKPEGMTDEECGSLPTYSDGIVCLSCWRMTWRERLVALFTGRVWLGVFSGRTQPPVWLTVKRPFLSASEVYRAEEKERHRDCGHHHVCAPPLTKAGIVLLTALSYALIAAPAHGDEVFMGPRLRRLMAQAGAPTQPAPPAPQDTKAAADATKNVNVAQETDCHDGSGAAQLNCGPAFVDVGAAYLFASTGQTPNTGHIGAFLKAEAPAKFGSRTLGRVFAGVNFQQAPGQSVTLDPQNFQALEGYAGVSRILGVGGGASVAALCEAWIDQKLTPEDPAAVNPATWGWGCGLGARGDDGTHVSVEAGQDTYAGDVGGLQVRMKARFMIPGAAVGGQKFASIYVDARLSFAPAAQVAADVVGPRPLHTAILYGFGVSAVPLWNALTHAGGS